MPETCETSKPIFAIAVAAASAIAVSSVLYKRMNSTASTKHSTQRETSASMAPKEVTPISNPDPSFQRNLVRLCHSTYFSLPVLQLPAPEVYDVPNISDYLPAENAREAGLSIVSGYMESDDFVLADITRCDSAPTKLTGFLRAGPRPFLYFKRAEVVAAIVSCGGLCPGMNDVIRGLYSTLKITYGCDKIYGIFGGYGGFYSDLRPPRLLQDADVELIHHTGGTILASSRYVCF